jgi:hypothetical protein
MVDVKFIHIILLLTKYSSGDEIEKNEMGGVCSTYGRRGEVLTGFWWGNMMARDHLEYPVVDEGNIKVDLREVGWGARTGLLWLSVGARGGLL